MHYMEIINETKLSDAKVLSRTKWNNFEEVEDWILKNGYEKKETGGFSSIYSKPSYNTVVKVSYISDDCWLSYAIEAKRNYGKIKHLPKISFINDFYSEKHNKNLFVVLMEKLYPIKNQHNAIKFIDHINNYIDMFKKDSYDDETYNAIIKDFPDIPKLADMLINEGILSDRCLNDIKIHNIMENKNSEIILVDPVKERRS